MKAWASFLDLLLRFFLLSQSLAADPDSSLEFLSSSKSRFNATFVASKDKDLALFISITSGALMGKRMNHLHLRLIIALNFLLKRSYQNPRTELTTDLSFSFSGPHHSHLRHGARYFVSP